MKLTFTSVYGLGGNVVLSLYHHPGETQFFTDYPVGKLEFSGLSPRVTALFRRGLLSEVVITPSLESATPIPPSEQLPEPPIEPTPEPQPSFEGNDDAPVTRASRRFYRPSGRKHK